MDKRTELLLAEARVYKEEIRRSQFMLSQFCERLRLTENEALTSQAEDILDGIQTFEKISALLGDAAAELEKVPEEEISEDIPAAEEVPAYDIPQEVVQAAPEAPADFPVFEAAPEAPADFPVFEAAPEAPADFPVFEAAPEAPADFPVFEAAPETPADFPVFKAVTEVRDDAPVFGFSDVFSGEALSAEAHREEVDSAPAFEFSEEAPVFAPVVESSVEAPVFTPTDDIMQRFVEEEPVFAPAVSSVPEAVGEQRCENCGAIVKENYAFCSVCGTKLKKAEEKISDKGQSFVDFLAQEPALSQRVFPDFNDVAEEEGFDEKDFLPRENVQAADNVAVSTARPAAFLVNHRDNSIIPIVNDEFFIGRDPAKTNYCIPDNSAISRVHAKIYFADGHHFITDCNSVNGTYVNENRIMPSDSFVLFDGSEIRLNTERFTFRIS